MKLQKLYSYTRQAINDFNLIQDGDKIAIGVSGGKDSLTLLYALSGLQKFISEKIELVAITVDLGFGNFEIENPLVLGPMAGVTDWAFRNICAELGANITVTEMVSSRALVYQDKKSVKLLRKNFLFPLCKNAKRCFE